MPPANHPVPSDVSATDVAQYCLMLADDSLVLAHQLSRWGVHGLRLADSEALLRIAAGLLNHSRYLLSRTAALSQWRDEDELAHYRGAGQFRNVRLVEIDCGPYLVGAFPATVVRLLVFCAWRRAVLARLASSREAVLAALAVSALDTVTRYRDRAAQWVLRHAAEDVVREHVVNGFRRVWPFTGELFAPHPVELRLADAGCAVDPSEVRAEVSGWLAETLGATGLSGVDVGEFSRFVPPGGRDGVHTAGMDFLVADMQHLTKAE